MKAIDIPVGAFVRAKDVSVPAHKRPTGMVVANNLRYGDEVIVVEWDTSREAEPVHMDTVDVITESQLESDFMDLLKQIKSKMETAAHAIKEAQKMALLNGYDLHGYDLTGAMTPLTNVMEEIGWRTSSLFC